MGLANSITFNGLNSLDLNLYVQGDKVFDSAEKDYERYSIPGRSGDLFLFNNRYKNVSVTYRQCILFETPNSPKYDILTRQLRAWLMYENGYFRLEDTYNPDEYRLAQFLGPVEFNTILLQAGKIDLTFNCRAERFLKDGEVPLNINNNNIVENPTLFKSRPLLKIGNTGSNREGIISFTSEDEENPYATFTIKTQLNEIYIDCDARICFGYDEFGNIQLENNNLIIESDINDYPEIKLGNTKISYSGSITSLELTPRWWIL